MKIFIRRKCLLILLIVICTVLTHCQNSNTVDKKKAYHHHIGHLDPANKDFSEDFKRCSDTLPIGFYHSSAPHAYKGSKRAFVSYIHENYKNKGFSESGFLNLRFLINCEGEIGNMEINKLDKDYLPTDLNDDMVEQLVHLSVNKQNWRLPNFDKPYDVYMYLIYKIENGNIAEILP